MTNKNFNAIGIAVELAKSDKYKDDRIVQALLSNFETSRAILRCNSGVTEGFDPLEAYMKGVNGIEGYSESSISKSTIEITVGKSIRRMLQLTEVQSKAESLILVLKAHGEDIVY